MLQKMYLLLNNNVNKHYIFPSNEDNLDLLTFLANIHDQTVHHLQQRGHTLKKWYLNVHVTMQRQNGVVLEESALYFKSKTNTLLDVNDSLNDDVNNAYQSLYKHFGRVQ